MFPIVANLKQRFIKYLLGAALLLLIANIAIDVLKKSKPKKETNTHELSVAQIEKVFFSVLDDYGIEKNWIVKKKIEPSEEDSITAQYFVNIPADIPTIFIIKEINKIIEKEITAFVSEEKKIYGTTEIRIYTNEILKLKGTLIPNSNNVRRRNDIAFIINDAFDLSSGNFDQLLKIHHPLACMVVPDRNAASKADSIKNYSKEFVVILNNKINDSKMKLEPDYQKGMLKSSVGNIIDSFKDSKAFLVDEKSDLFNSPIYNFVRDEFKRRGVTLFPRSEFIELTNDTDSELFSKFKFYCDDTTRTRPKLFIVSYNTFQKVLPLLEQFKKKGNKIVPVSKTYLVQKSAEENIK